MYFFNEAYGKSMSCCILKNKIKLGLHANTENKVIHNKCVKKGS